MSKPKRSEQGSIIAFFSLKPLDECEGLLSIVGELMKARRRQEGRASSVPKKVKKVVEPVVAQKPTSSTPLPTSPVGGSIQRTFPPDSAAKVHDSK